MVGGRPTPVPLRQHSMGGGGRCRPPRSGGVQGGIAHDRLYPELS
jgi:hypothetical protein